jgi:hypothetical protein
MPSEGPFAAFCAPPRIIEKIPPDEFRVLIAQAVATTGGSFRHTVAPLWIRQMADIRY